MTKRRATEDANSSDEEESYEHSIPVLIFLPVLPLKNRSIALEALVQWERRRSEYEAKMKAHCRSSGDNYDHVTQGDKKTDKKPFSQREPPSPFPKCQEMHWFDDCTKATEAEKVARQKLREASMKRLQKFLPTTSRPVTINGVLELPCCPDTGSDLTVLNRSHWTQLLAADPTVTQISLDTPVQILTYGANPVVASSKSMLHILIHTAAGPVQQSEDLPCLIVDKDYDEFIIGRDLLGTLEIGVGKQLEQLAAHRDAETSGDPSDLEAEEPPVNQGHTTTDKEIRVVVEALIQRYLEN
ncbi:hypothetical protein PC118_g7300 [Phytophthora cactorum]|uniref:Uncharacterized protein n=1 Tax=Phytophthora cactorum TaxID=29920 RepID=A0A329RZC4_9STRA|nr:hypothetical protein PC111_g1096 [Phytophthora cactorum]KAG2890988.1 hypothetical protein PC114_g17180 [Phytophthora cactorum]KAG2987423.1 hypothetical protein PC118_g7300 [Phytophthora cactorum]KAG3001052.1 hypothetical protein PC119_g16854 [Phytophthora cactorum]RAW30057.1 hypothetical protein PC110_g13577 [Phytophthora cactorum]